MMKLPKNKHKKCSKLTKMKSKSAAAYNRESQKDGTFLKGILSDKS